MGKLSDINLKLKPREVESRSNGACEDQVRPLATYILRKIN